MSLTKALNSKRLENTVNSSNLQDLIKKPVELQLKQYLLMLYYQSLGLKQRKDHYLPDIDEGKGTQSNLPLEITAYIYGQHEDNDAVIIQILNLQELAAEISNCKCGDSGSKATSCITTRASKRRRSDTDVENLKAKYDKLKLDILNTAKLIIASPNACIVSDDCLIVPGVSAESIDVKALKDNLKQKYMVDFNISVKSAVSDWIPKFSGTNLMNEVFGIQKAGFGFKFNFGFMQFLLKYPIALVAYLNQFIFIVDNPDKYGWRSYDDCKYQLGGLYTLKQRFSDEAVAVWLQSDCKKSFIKVDFIVDDKCSDENVFNDYSRPPMQSYGRENIWRKCPRIYDFLMRIISNNDQQVFEYLIQWLAKMWKQGQTQKALVLLGCKGIGKSTFIELASEIVSREYVSNLKNIDDLKSRFNNFMYGKVLVGVEEVGEGAYKDQTTQNLLKTYITEPYMRVEQKNVDSFSARNNCNFVICSNYSSPVDITEDNRRFVVLAVNEEEKQNIEYFSELRKETHNNGIISSLRYYLYHNVEIPECLSVLKTEKEKELLVQNTPSYDIFLSQVFQISDDSQGRLFREVFDEYSEWCKLNGEKACSDQKFSQCLQRHGFKSQRVGRKKLTMIHK